MTHPTFPHLDLSQEGHVLHLELNRPDKSNALNDPLWQSLRQAFEWADGEPSVRVVVLSGAGKNFCAGIDLAMLMQLSQLIADDCEGRKREKLRRKILELQAVANAIEQCRKPVIAALHGACVGGAIDLVVAADIRYASADAYFAVKEIDMAMAADVGTLQRLPRLVGEGIAREWCLTGRRVAAAEAEWRGLVNQVLADSTELLEHAFTQARALAAKSPLALRGTKQVLNYSRDHSIPEGLEYVATWNASMLLSNDIQSAVMAAMQNTQPHFAD